MWQVKGACQVLYDLPLAYRGKFKRVTGRERLQFCRHLSQLTDNEINADDAILFSSTSWTADEDFSVLLDALISYEQAATNSSKLPDLTVIITGRGPQKEFYLRKIEQLQMDHVTIITPWLEL